jgi:hypothetical protein
MFFLFFFDLSALLHCFVQHWWMDAAIAVVRPGIFLPAQQQVMLSALLQHVLRAHWWTLDATAIAVCIAAATGGLIACGSAWFRVLAAGWTCTQH